LVYNYNQTGKIPIPSEALQDVLRDLKARGLAVGARLAVRDGALGFWGALEQVFPETTHQCCWFHKMGNVLAALPKSLQGKAEATDALQRFLARYRPNYPKAAEKLEKDRNALLAFYAAEHWLHLRTTNPIESTFATVRHRTRRTKNCVSHTTFLSLAFKLAEDAAKSWRRIRSPEKLASFSPAHATKTEFR